MSDLLIDKDTGDLVLAKGDVVLAEGEDGVGQRIRDRLRTFVGEWFLDTEFGLSYREQIVVKNPALPVVSAILKAEILRAAGEGAAITAFDLSLDSAERKLTGSFTVALPSGETVSETVTL